MKSKQESGSSTCVKLKDLQSQVSGFGAQLLDRIKLQNAREDTHRKELKTWQDDVNHIQQQMLANLSNSGMGREFSSNTGNQYASRNNNNLGPSWQYGCCYCGASDHRQDSCPHRHEHARQGLIILTPDGRWKLLNDWQLPPGNGKTLKQRVEEIHAKHQEMATNYYNTYMFLAEEKPTMVWNPPVHQQFVQSASVIPALPAPSMSDTIEKLMRETGVSLNDISTFVQTRRKDYGHKNDTVSPQPPNL